MIKKLHPIAGALALLTIASFWLSTVLSELFASQAAVIAVKTAIPWGFLLLVPAMAAAGGSGFGLARGRKAELIGTKVKRMPLIAANGILVLIPAALFLCAKAKAGEFDTAFNVVQAVELLAGAANLALMGLNMRDGLKLTGKLDRQNGAPEVQVLSREIVADGTMALRLTKPSGFQHLAGQAVSLTLVNPPETDAKGNSRTLSLASAPHEPELMVATRIRDSAFKRSLKSLPMGCTLQLRGPFGEMTLHDDPARPAVFLAGGIGITPFLSMVRHAAEAKLSHRITLFYSNRRVEDAAFLDELQQLERINPNFRLITTMTATSGSMQPWSGETGAIDAAMLSRYLPDVLAPIYYFAGPPAMGEAMQNMLKRLGVAKEAMRFEGFSGY